MTKPLDDRVALVAGSTRGAGRGISVELGDAGATVYVTGRSTRAGRSPMNRPETIEETAEVVTAAGGTASAVPVDHLVPDQVAALVRRIDEEQGRLDILVNDVWGRDPMINWSSPFWEHSLDGLLVLRQAIDTHLITSWHAVPLMLQRDRGLIVEVNDGTGEEGYRRNHFYDLAKYGVVRLAQREAHELRDSGITVVCLSPGFLRSEAVLVPWPRWPPTPTSPAITVGRSRPARWRASTASPTSTGPSPTSGPTSRGTWGRGDDVRGIRRGDEGAG
jgi:NAD(P)-dependent dehydrogenase (short-subunit alcohol dehydrogenase family)